MFPSEIESLSLPELDMDALEFHATAIPSCPIKNCTTKCLIDCPLNCPLNCAADFNCPLNCFPFCPALV